MTIGPQEGQSTHVATQTGSSSDSFRRYVGKARKAVTGEEVAVHLSPRPSLKTGGESGLSPDELDALVR